MKNIIVDKLVSRLTADAETVGRLADLEIEGR